MDQHDEFVRTIAYGESALGHLRGNALPAYPRNYELWYTYAAGYNQALNKALNELLRRSDRLTADESNEVYDRFLSPMRFGDRVDHIGGRLAAELRSVGEALEGARGSAEAYGHVLEGATSHLARGSTDSGALRTVAEGLLAETRQMESRNGELERALAESKRQIDNLQISLEAIRNESLTDPLTSLANRKCFDQSMERVFQDARGSGKPFCLLLTDIDHFKKFNDTYGHQTGDQVLRLVASALKQNVKVQDVAARYGGEEFAVILPNTTLDLAIRIGEQIREAVMAKELVKRSTGERLGRVTISVGCAMWTPQEGTAALLERADSAMYRAKHLGRNRTCSERDLLDQVAAVA